MGTMESVTCWERLVNVPDPLFYESASCWLSRLALSQGTDLRDLLTFLGLANKGDIDRQLHGSPLQEIRDICNLPLSALAVHERVMVGLESMREVGAKYLVTSKANRPRFRFCPLCISSMQTPYFPIHWRFVAWRWCPDHDCLLEDACPHCGSEIVFPTDIALSGPGKLGYGFLNRCMSCGAQLSEIEPCRLEVNGFRLVSEMEEMSLRNGRALLATLYYGRFRIEGKVGWLHPKKFREVERRGVLPVRFDWLRPAVVRRRSNQGLPSGCCRWTDGHQPFQNNLKAEKVQS
ncbi:MAG: TniQ family protein [Rhodocyclaceae bacterium]